MKEGKSGKKWKCNFLHPRHRHAASDIPPENAPIARSLWSRSWGFFRLRSVPKPRPTSPAIRQGRVGFWPSARTALARGAAPAQIAGPTGCRIGGLGRFRKGRSARLTDVFAQQIHKCALPCIEGAAAPMLTHGDLSPQACQRWPIDPCRRDGRSACKLHHAHRGLPRSDRRRHARSRRW